MANTYELIASNTLTSTASSVTFSSIPSTYTDLVLRVTARSNYGYPRDYCQIQFNSNTNTLYSHTFIEAFDNSAFSARGNGNSEITEFGVPGSTTTSNTFGSLEVYIPNYTGSQFKQINIRGNTENSSSSGVEIKLLSGLFRSTTAISSIRFASNNSTFVSGSSFYLYGIKKS